MLLSTIAFGINPRNGGSPPNDSSKINNKVAKKGGINIKLNDLVKVDISLDVKSIIMAASVKA